MLYSAELRARVPASLATRRDRTRSRPILPAAPATQTHQDEALPVAIAIAPGSKLAASSCRLPSGFQPSLDGVHPVVPAGGEDLIDVAMIAAQGGEAGLDDVNAATAIFTK